MLRFVDAVKTLSKGTTRNKDSILSKAVFAWHGTGSVVGIQGICNEGFDPKRRSGQAKGPGEYFGVSPGVSSGYCGNQKHMILALVLHEAKESTHHPRFAYVVNNPRDWSVSYCLPVLVVSFGTPCWSPADFANAMRVPIDWGEPQAGAKQLQPKHQSGARPLAGLEAHAWKAPWRWHWEKDGGGYEAYNDQFNACIEATFEAQGGHGRFTTPPIVRYIDDRPQLYHIDFGASTQTNASTSYVRGIMRKRVEVPIRAAWEYHDQQWHPYELLVQAQIESAFRAYSDGTGPVTIAVSFPGRPETYQLDFLHGNQTNSKSGETRHIRRQ
jgi:hypothetical protein